MSQDGDPVHRVAVGRITRAHGIRGEVAVLVLTEVEGRFDVDATVTLENGRTLSIEEVRPNRGRLLVRFRGVPDRTTAETLAGQYMFVPEEDVPPPPEGAFWPHQLEGCEVLTESGRQLGVVREVVSGPANDWWVVRSDEDDRDETMVPALKDVVVSVDVSARRVVVRDVPGLTAPEQPR
ncbi:MAG: ribosome maturation factor RimM [Actinomycetota bacterium]|nr:ribosome maturation factor RimM [Actinomycetota bacterium]